MLLYDATSEQFRRDREGAAVARVLGEEAASKQFGFMIDEREKDLVLEEEIERKS